MENGKVYFVQETKISYKNGRKYDCQISCDQDAVDFVRHCEGMQEYIEHHEMIYAIYLNQASKVVGVMKAGDGGINSVTVDIRTIFQGALLHNAVALIVIHNHPSGKLTASHQDIELHKKIYNAGNLLNIKLLDAIIVTADKHESFLYKVEK